MFRNNMRKLWLTVQVEAKKRKIFNLLHTYIMLLTSAIRNKFPAYSQSLIVSPSKAFGLPFDYGQGKRKICYCQGQMKEAIW